MTAARILGRIQVVATPGDPRRGVLEADGIGGPCALGRAGTTRDKHEGDGATPLGTFRLVSVLHRPDRGPPPVTALPVTAIRPDDGWCDDPADRAYNQAVTLPYAGRHERLWREDHVYDLIVILDYNLAPVVSGKGSAIFLHLAREDYAPTEGCVAVDAQLLRRVLERCGPLTEISIR